MIYVSYKIILKKKERKKNWDAIKQPAAVSVKFGRASHMQGLGYIFIFFAPLPSVCGVS